MPRSFVNDAARGHIERDVTPEQRAVEDTLVEKVV